MATIKTATCTALIPRSGTSADGKEWSMVIGHFVCVPDSEGQQEVFSAVIPSTQVDRVYIGSVYDVLVSFELPKKPQKVCRISHIMVFD